MGPPDSDVSSSDSRTEAAVATAPARPSLRARARHVGRILRDYLELTKPEISFLVTVSALAGFLLGSPGSLSIGLLAWTLLGVGLCAGGVGVLNHVMEAEFDARMKRTADRPLPDGRLSKANARRVGIGMVFASVGLLCPLVNPLSAFLAAVTAALYLFVYTPLKRTTKWNTLIGTIPGALPALGGYAAATGTLEPAGWALFAILAFWQMPHFLSLAWMYRKDYARGDYAMLPVVEPDGDSTARQTVGFTGALLLASVAPTALGAAGWVYAVGVVPLGVWFLWTAIAFARRRTGRAARRVLKASIVYVPVLVAFLFVDWMLGDGALARAWSAATSLM
jgi:protoheme IX farnesyltransferase